MSAPKEGWRPGYNCDRPGGYIYSAGELRTQLEEARQQIASYHRENVRLRGLIEHIAERDSNEESFDDLLEDARNQRANE